MKGKADTSKKGGGRLRARGGAGKGKKASAVIGAGQRKEPAAARGKPERPPSAFFLFWTDFTQDYNGDLDVKVNQAAGKKWGEMSQKDKQPYVDKAWQQKEAYWKIMEESTSYDEDDEENEDDE